MPGYEKPPITEAVLELRFTESTSRTALEGAARRLASAYPISETDETLGFSISIEQAQQGQAPKEMKRDWLGFKLSTKDRVEMVLLRKDLIAAIRLPPYSGWDSFRGQFERACEALRKAAGFRPLARIGIRYVNRIDIPNTKDGLILVEDYITVLPSVPLTLSQPMTAYNVHSVRPLGVDQCEVSVGSASAVSPLIGHSSFLLDIDLFRTQDLPLKEDELWKLIERMRAHKNAIFESCITDNSRALFRK